MKKIFKIWYQALKLQWESWLGTNFFDWRTELSPLIFAALCGAALLVFYLMRHG